MRRIVASVALRYRLFVSAMILLLALLNPLACIIHCALAQLPGQHMHDHHTHQHAQMALDANAADGVHFLCDRHMLSFAAPESSAPLAPPMPQALYELVTLPHMLPFLPALLAVAGVFVKITSPLQWSAKPNPPPPRPA